MYESEFDVLFGAGGGDAVKEAVTPPMDPSMMGGPPPGGPPPMDPSMMGGPPPGGPPPGGPPPMDPSMMGGPPADPAMAPPGGDPGAAGGLDPATLQAIQQAVQQATAQSGGGAAGAPGTGLGKAGKPDVAVELQKLNDQCYKLGLIMTLLANSAGIQLPMAVTFGPPPETLDPAAQALAAAPGAGGPPPADPTGAAGPPDGGVPKAAAWRQPFPDPRYDFDAVAGGGFDFDRAVEEFDGLTGKAALHDPGPRPVGRVSGIDRDRDVDSPMLLAAALRRRVHGY